MALSPGIRLSLAAVALVPLAAGPGCVDNLELSNVIGELGKDTAHVRTGDGSIVLKRR